MRFTETDAEHFYVLRLLMDGGNQILAEVKAPSQTTAMQRALSRYENKALVVLGFELGGD